MSAVGEDMVVCFQFRMSHFSCKAFLAHGTQDGGSQHVKFQTIFEDNRRSLGGEQGYYVANHWNSTRRYTRLKCSSSGAGRSSVFTLEYDILLPAHIPHTSGMLLLTQTLKMWYTSMVACVMHLVEPLELPFATHEMIMANTLAVTVKEEDTALQEEQCPICLEQFRVGDTVRRLPCLHIFHMTDAHLETTEQCRHCNIDKHLIHNKQCPVCKLPIDIMSIAAAAGGPRGGSSSSGVLPEGAVLPDATKFVALPAAVSQPAPEEQEAADAAGGVGPLVAVEGAAPPEGVAPPNASPLDESLAELPAATAVAAAAAEGAGASGAPSTTAAGAETGAAAGATAEAARQTQEVAGDAALAAVPPPGSAQGLPAQAAELEQAVRSLQARWLQIQGVVQGMQHMLHYIEDNHEALSGGNAAGGPMPPAEAAAPPSTGATDASSGGVVSTTSQAAQAADAERPHQQPVAASGGGPAAVASAALPAGEASTVAAVSSVPPAQASAAAVAPVASTTEAAPAAVRAPATVEPAAPTNSSEQQRPPPAATAGARPSHALPVQALSPPFTEREKITMALAWRQRRQRCEQ